MVHYNPSKNLFNTETIHKEVAEPTNPSEGYNKLYFKSDDKLYRKDSSGVEQEVGSVAGDFIEGVNIDKIIVSETEPVSSVEGDLWIDVS